MNIPLNEFEQIIDETILKRGLSYFKKGKVNGFTELANGEYQTGVSGTEEYTVQFKIKNNVIIEHNCDCPYDWGPVCKHVVASIFYLKQDELGLNQKQVPSKGKKRNKSVAQQMKEILNKASHEELKDFIEKYSKRNKRFKSLFLSNFAYLNANQSKSFYQKQIKSVIKSVADRHGFIDWDKMKYLSQGIEPIITILKKQFSNKNYISAFYISTALLEEMLAAIEYSDDGNGVITEIIDDAQSMLHNIAAEDISEETRTKFFNYCISSSKKQLFTDWGRDIELLEIARKIANNEKEADKIIECLDIASKIEYKQGVCQLIKLEIITEYKDKTEVQKFAEKHITNPRIRNYEIAKAVDNQELERAIKLCKDGIEHNKKGNFGFANNWYNWLLKIAQIENSTEGIIEYARFLFIANLRSEQDYYKILKQNVAADKWNDFLEEVIGEITRKGSWMDSGLIREIFIREKWWDRLLLLTKENASLQSIAENEKYLAKDYSKELIELYDQELIRYADNNMGRKSYQTACRYLRRLKKLGGNEKTNELISYFRETYPRRRAFLEELNNV